MLYALDFIGTFAFAAYGAHLAQRKSFDIFGITVCALLSAFGGGTLRELLLNRIPAFFSDYTYLVAAACGIVFAIVTYAYFEKMHRLLLVLDAIGLVTFAYLGAHAAHEAALGIVGIVLFATMTAVGGGILRDIAVKEIPLVFYEDLYATPALLLGTLYALFASSMSTPVVVYLLLGLVFLFRILAIRYKWHLWRPQSTC